MKRLNSVLNSSRRILIAVLVGIVGALTLPDLNWRRSTPSYVRESVNPEHREAMLPIVDLWNRSPDGPAFCGEVKSLPGCWDVSDNFVPGNVIVGIVRTENSQSLLVSILPPYPPAQVREGNSSQGECPVIVYHVPQSAGAFLVDQFANIRSVERNAGFRQQSNYLKQLTAAN